MKCSCTKDHVSELQDQAQLMEQELHKWKQHVNETRERFYAMNYYTTTQLLYLQKELGTLKCSDFTSSLNHQALLLLQSICYEMTANEAQEVIIHSLKGCKEVCSVRINDTPSILCSALANDASQLKTENPECNTVSAKDRTLSSRIAALTTTQKVLYDNLSEGHHYNPDLILKGLEACEVPDIYELSNWCNEHINDFECLVDEQEPVLTNVPDFKQVTYFNANNEENGMINTQLSVLIVTDTVLDW